MENKYELRVSIDSKLPRAELNRIFDQALEEVQQLSQKRDEEARMQAEAEAKAKVDMRKMLTQRAETVVGSNGIREISEVHSDRKGGYVMTDEEVGQQGAKILDEAKEIKGHESTFPTCTRQVLQVNSVLQPWVFTLGLRHQGVLLTAVRGCDTAPKNDASKDLVRCYRAAVLNSHCGDSAKAKTFIQAVRTGELKQRMDAYLRNLDHYPHHYNMHLIHAAQIVGYKGTIVQRHMWEDFYRRAVKGLHMSTETEWEMDKRLNADEEAFANNDRV